MSAGFGAVLITEGLHYSRIGSGIDAHNIGHMDADLDDKEHPEHRRENRDGRAKYFEVVLSMDDLYEKGARLQTTTFACSLHAGCFAIGTIFKCPDGLQRTVAQIIDKSNHQPYFALIDAQGRQLTMRVYNQSGTSDDRRRKDKRQWEYKP